MQKQKIKNAHLLLCYCYETKLMISGQTAAILNSVRVHHVLSSLDTPHQVLAVHCAPSQNQTIPVNSVLLLGSHLSCMSSKKIRELQGSHPVYYILDIFLQYLCKVWTKFQLWNARIFSVASFTLMKIEISS